MRRLPVLVCFIGLLVSAGYVSGATITVTTTKAGRVVDGLCSFIEAIENANDGAIHSDCDFGGDGLDTIELGHGEVYAQPLWSWWVIQDETVIDGNQSTIAPEKDSWASGLWCNADCTLRSLTIKGYFDTAAVLAISAEHHLALDGCTITENSVGVYGRGPVSVEHSRLTSNTVGIFVVSSSVMRYSIISGNALGIGLGSSSDSLLDRCTVSNNVNGLIHSGSGRLDIRASTFSGNGRKGPFRLGANCAIVVGYGNDVDDSAQLLVTGTSIVNNNHVGGICIWGTADTTIDCSTFNNTSPSVYLYRPSETPGETILTIRDSTMVGAVGIEAVVDENSPTTRYAQIKINNTVIAGPEDWYWPSYNCKIREYGGSTIEADFVSLGFNLVDDDTCGLDHHTDMIVDDVMLSELGDFGGPTFVQMPLDGSPTIDMGDNDCLRLDQRGYLRPADGDGDGVAHCDCGAVEYGAVPPPRPIDPPPP